MEPGYAPVDEVERELLDAIIAAPSADAPRLVYADWLQARGEVRGVLHGELIVVQCELSSLRREAQSAGGSARIAGLEAVEAELLARPELAWISSFIEHARRSFGGSTALRRGLVPTTALVSRGEPLLRWHEGLARLAPFASRLLVLDLRWGELGALLRAGCLHGARRLELHGARHGEQDERGAPLVGASFERLEKLELHRLTLSQADAAQLFSLSFPVLRSLRLEHTSCGRGALVALAERKPPQLRVLRLLGDFRYYPSDEVSALADMGLRELHVRGGYMGAGDIQRLRRAIPRCKLRFDTPVGAVG